MTTDNDLWPGSFALRHPKLWEIYIPIAAAVVPAGIFSLLRLVNHGFDKPGVSPSLWVMATMAVLQMSGIVAMAVVILTRGEFTFTRLSNCTNRNPPAWRKFLLSLSIACLLLFDVTTNISAAFAGAEILLLMAVPAFVAYVLCARVAFVWLGGKA